MLDIVTILVTHLEGVDLNLLPPLAALLEEQHVTRAAGRSGLSQPAMSRALARLRQVLDDQLLVRHGTGYVLTPRAERIQRQLAGLIPRLETLFAAEVFDPATAEENYRIGGGELPDRDDRLSAALVLPSGGSGDQQPLAPFHAASRALSR